MASVCGTSLSLMDAGVPVKAPVAGIAMGLIKEGDRFAVLSDILGDEDHLGDMDFKVAGSEAGITALQMDIKIEGINEEIMQIALAQAKDGRNFILGEMNKVISEPRGEMSEYAPRLMTIKVHPDKIRDVIGKGGVTIRSITEETGCTIDIADDGTITIASVNKEAADDARKRIEQITADIEPGQVFEGKVIKIMNFGAFVTLTPGRDGLVHISQLSEERVENVTDVVSEGQMVQGQSAGSRQAGAYPSQHESGWRKRLTRSCKQEMKTALIERRFSYRDSLVSEILSLLPAITFPERISRGACALLFRVFAELTQVTRPALMC